MSAVEEHNEVASAGEATRHRVAAAVDVNRLAPHLTVPHQPRERVLRRPAARVGGAARCGADLVPFRRVHAPKTDLLRPEPQPVAVDDDRCRRRVCRRGWGGGREENSQQHL